MDTYQSFVKYLPVRSNQAAIISSKLNYAMMSPSASSSMSTARNKKTAAPNKRITFSSLNGYNSSPNKATSKPAIDIRNADYLQRIANANATCSTSGSVDTASLVDGPLPGFFLSEQRASVEGKTELHRKIIEIGDTLHERIVANIRRECEKRCRAREQETCERVRNEAEARIRDERAQGAARLDAARHELASNYEQLLLDKTKEIELYNQNAAKEQIERHKAEAKLRLEQQLANLREELRAEKEAAVERATAAEASAASVRLEQQRVASERQLAQLDSTWSGRMRASLDEQRRATAEQLAAALRAASLQSEVERRHELDEVHTRYAQSTQRQRDQLESALAEIAQRDEQAARLRAHNEQLRDQLEQLQREFQSCVARFSHLNKDEADFLFTYTSSVAGSPPTPQR